MPLSFGRPAIAMADHSRTPARGRTWREALTSRHGAIGVAFAVAATALLGMTALATEAGVWLTARRNAQGAADAAAYAGLVSLSLRGTSSVVTTGRQVATRNGFTDSTNFTSAGDTRVRVDPGLWNGSTFTTPTPSGSSANAVRVQIEQIQRTGLAQLISSSVPIAWGGAIAILQDGGPACTLSIPHTTGNKDLSGQTTLGGSTTLSAPNCLIASNATGSRAINLQGINDPTAVTVAGLRASGQCYNCDDATTTGGYMSGAPQTPNPYTAIDAWTMPTSSGNSACSSTLRFDSTGAIMNGNGGTATTLVPTAYRTSGSNTYTSGGHTYSVSSTSTTFICDSISIGSGQTMVLNPGTYFFRDASLSMTGGAITCNGCEAGRAGVTLVFTGTAANKVGSIQITGGDFTLIAPGTGYGNPSIFDGMVIYRDDLGSYQNDAQDGVFIRGNSNSTLFGGVYIPTSTFTMVGTSDMRHTTAGDCIAVVAGEITFSGNSQANVDACTANGTKVARVRYVRFAQ